MTKRDWQDSIDEYIDRRANVERLLDYAGRYLTDNELITFMMMINGHGPAVIAKTLGVTKARGVQYTRAVLTKLAWYVADNRTEVRWTDVQEIV